MISRFVCAALLGSLLVGCSSSPEKERSTNLPAELLATSRQLLKVRREGPVRPTSPTREVIASLTEPVLQINPELAGGSDFLRRAVSRNDSRIGTIEVWNSSVLAHVFLRNGVLVGTRGVGGDMISADATATIRALQSRADSSGMRRYTISDGDVTTTDYQFRCSVRNLGVQNITVAYQGFEVTKMRESCVGVPQDNFVITNDYWAETATGVIRKSRQWVGPRVGYFEFILLKN